jgi:hypothetical protein
MGGYYGGLRVHGKVCQVGVKPDRIRTDNPYTISYSIFIFGFGSGTDADSNSGLCGFE